MALGRKLDEHYDQRQKTVFSRWVANVLKERKIEFDDIMKDFQSGVNLINLYELLSKKTVHNWNKVPKKSYNMIENCNIAIEKFKDDGLNLINISGNDIYESKNIKLVLGLVWQCVLKYNISDEVDDSEDAPGVSPLQALLNWCKKKVANYPDAKDFTNYPISICALVHSFKPDAVDYDSLDPNNQSECAEKAIEACKAIDCPVYIDPSDLHGHVDDKLLFTQLAALKKHLSELIIPNRPFVLTIKRGGKKYGLRLTDQLYLNSAGYKFELAEPNHEDIAQKFEFGDGDDITLIKPLSKYGWVFDVANANDLNPPEGTPFYVFMIHGRHNQRFTYKNKRIVATQNEQCITYQEGKEDAFVMMAQKDELKEDQEFKLTYL